MWRAKGGFAENRNLAGVREQQRRDCIEKSGFARAIGTQNAKNFTLANGERNPLEGTGPIAEGFSYIADDNRVHTSILRRNDKTRPPIFRGAGVHDKNWPSGRPVSWRAFVV